MQPVRKTQVGVPPSLPQAPACRPLPARLSPCAGSFLASGAAPQSPPGRVLSSRRFCASRGPCANGNCLRPQVPTCSASCTLPAWAAPSRPAFTARPPFPCRTQRTSGEPRTRQERMCWSRARRGSRAPSRPRCRSACRPAAPPSSVVLCSCRRRRHAQLQAAKPCCAPRPPLQCASLGAAGKGKGRRQLALTAPSLTCVPCCPSLQTLADKGMAGMVHPPSITFRDFEKVRLPAPPGSCTLESICNTRHPVCTG